ncbi:DUF2220 family protein [Oleiagrimonas citrea]|uniref:DUF2399 domain-containing protein n=1 Tax=Oleiagrimonas citrea TaxID=1665687 RepID=A0A846ZIZ3_9GAMM|nr:Wadjet anti-phage system protein JetD domain-containing protein [Oleiagrimonas citrea]NKZ37341.1 DUF2399 domain-containing protein [Oleiagrimonas citrea]
MSAASQVLERLLRRAEKARQRGASEHVSLRMTSPSAAREYVGLDTLRERDIFHAEMSHAERDGAISIERDRRGGDAARLVRITVADVAKLAHYLGIPLVADSVANASKHLEHWTSRFPVIEQVLARWREGKKVRSHGPEGAQDLRDAAYAVASRLDDEQQRERILRRESVRLFGDSKRVEVLTLWLEILVTSEIASSGLAREDIWAQIGLRREPLPFLVSGRGDVLLPTVQLPLVQPYLGLPAETVISVATEAHSVLTIENLATFHDAAPLASATSSVLLLYTGGMPSPVWRAAYERLLRGLADEVAIYHWGDIDEGGFRIAEVLGRVVANTGRKLRPWKMSPADIDPSIRHGLTVPSAAKLASMQRSAMRLGWSEIVNDLGRMPITLEQEYLDPQFPS